jgi:hypothetical protein
VPIVVGCGGQASVGGDTNTNWLKQCDEDVECGDQYSCMCGHCTMACQEDTDCSGQGRTAVCEVPEGSCEQPSLICRKPAPEEPEPGTDAGMDAGASSSDDVDASTSAMSDAVGCPQDPAACTEPPEIISFETSESALPGGGGEAELSWNVTGAASISLQSDRDAESRVVSGDTLTVSVTRTTAYTLVAENGAGTAQRGLSVEVSARGLVEWIEQADEDSSEARGIATDDEGNVFVVGMVQMAAQDQPDAFVARYDAFTGELVWSDQFGTDARDWANEVAVDGDGNFYVVGYTEGALGSSAADDSGAAFIVSYSPDGDSQWTRVISTPERDEAYGVAVVASGSVVVCGQLESGRESPQRGFVTSYDLSGEQLWIRELGGGEGGGSVAKDIAAHPSADVLSVVGSTDESLGDKGLGLADAFVAQYASDGELSWIRQFGTAEGDDAEGVVIDADGNTTIVGESYAGLGGPPMGGADVYLAQYSDAGELTWMQSLATAQQDVAHGVSQDFDGNLYVAGVTEGGLDGDNLGGYDMFVSKLTSGGVQLWSRQLGSARADYGNGVAADRDGNVFVVGSTLGDLEGDREGDSRSFVVRFR